VPLIKVSVLNIRMTKRKLCPVCGEKPVAVNCHHGDRVYYRSRCDSCIRKSRRLKPRAPLWFKQGYRKKSKCDRCGFKSKSDRQMFVFHVDGDLQNVDWNNLKTVCANCQIDLFLNQSGWAMSPSVQGF
jgi:ribosomal protein S27AE